MYLFIIIIIYLFFIHTCSIFNVNTMLWQYIVTIVMPIKHILNWIELNWETERETERERGGRSILWEPYHYAKKIHFLIYNNQYIYLMYLWNIQNNIFIQYITTYWIIHKELHMEFFIYWKICDCLLIYYNVCNTLYSVIHFIIHVHVNIHIIVHNHIFILLFCKGKLLWLKVEVHHQEHLNVSQW